MINIASVSPPEFVSNDMGIAVIPSGPAFIYLFRRYGYPHYYGFKNAAGYCVKTPIDDIHIDFSIKATNCYLGILADTKQYKLYYGDTERQAEVHKAISDCLLDQLRPVQINDVYVNILGREEFEYDEERQEIKGLVDYFEFDATPEM